MIDVSPHFARAITEAEHEQLVDLFTHPGWDVFMDFKQRDAISCIQRVMNPRIGDDERNKDISAYNIILQDITMKERLSAAVATAEQMTPKDFAEEETADQERTFLKRVFAALRKRA